MLLAHARCLDLDGPPLNPTFLVVAGLVVAAVAWWIFAPAQSKRISVAAEALGLSADGASFRGELDGRPVVLDEIKGVVRVSIGGPLRALALSRRVQEAAATPFQAYYRVRAVRLDTITLDGTGDASFDGRFLVGGEEVAFLAAWTPEARTMALTLDELAELDLDEDRLFVRVAASANVTAVARAAVALVEALHARPNGAASLLAAVTGDSEPGVRLRAFDALRGNFPDSREAAQATELLSAKKDPEEALLFALLSDDERAIRAAPRGVVAALVWRQPHIVREILLSHLEECGDPGVSALTILVGQGGASAGDRGTLVSVIESLGRVGGSEVIPELKRIAEGILVEPQLVEAARAALATVRERIGKADKGRVSVASVPEGGDLSEVGDGRLSDPEDGEPG